MEKQVKATRNNGKLSLYPLRLHEVVKGLLNTKPINNQPQATVNKDAKV